MPNSEEAARNCPGRPCAQPFIDDWENVSLAEHGLVLFAVGMGPLATPAATQAYPSNVIRLLTGAPAGSPSDIIARIVANQLSESEGWRIVAENKVGGIASPAADDVLKRPADGYSILITALTHSTASALMPNLGYRLDTDFAPVIKLATGHQVLVVNPSVPAKSLKELVTVLKSQPDNLNFSAPSSWARPTRPSGLLTGRPTTMSTAPPTTPGI